MKLCIFCSKKPIKKGATKYCSTRCQKEYELKIRIDKVLKTGVLYDRDTQRKSGKNILLRLRKHQCEICYTTEWMGQKVPLVMDHIDGDSTNNNLSNIRLVCGNCDMQLPTYKSKNIGNGRHVRRQRYNDGKSY